IMNAGDESIPGGGAGTRTQQLVMDHRWLVRTIALRVKARGVQRELDELTATGNVGLSEAARSWPGSGSFVRFAWKRVEGSILDGLRSEQRYRRATRKIAEIAHGYIDATD